MPLEPQVTKLLSGGLNLLPSGDAVPEGACIAAQNWRSDQQGMLRSRKSNSAAIASPGGYVHSLMTVKRSSVTVYTYPLVGFGGAIHGLWIDGTAYVISEGTYAAGQLAAAIAGLAAADPCCSVTASGDDTGSVPYTLTISLLPGVAGPIAVTGSDNNPGTALGTTRYTGADDKLYAGATEVASGFDGQPLGLASFQNRVWVANQGAAVQSKHDGVDWWNWTPAAPTAAPTSTVAPLAAAPTCLLGGIGTGNLKGPITYYATGIIPGVGEVVTSAPLVTVSPHGAQAWPWGTPVPLTPVTGISSWLGWADNESALITPPDFGNPAITEWNLYRVPPYDGIAVVLPDGAPPLLGPSFNLQQVPYRVNAEPIPIGDTYEDKAEDLTGSGGDNQGYAYLGTVDLVLYQAAAGTSYKYYVTGVTALGEETNPSPALALALGANAVTLTRPVFSDPQITGWNVYRENDTAALQPYRVNPDILPLSPPTYSDTRLDNTLNQYPAPGVGISSVTYVYTTLAVGQDADTVHTLTIAGASDSATYSVTQGTNNALQVAQALVLAAAVDPNCTVTLFQYDEVNYDGGPAWVTIALAVPGTGPFTISGSDTNPTAILAAATATTIAVDQSDQGIAELGIAMAINHDPAPPAMGVAGPFFQKLLAFNTPANPNRIFWTESDQPYYFPGSTSQQDGNWVDVGEQGEGVIAVAVFATYTVVLKEKTYWVITGDPDNWGSSIGRTNAEIGQIGARAFAVAGPVVLGQSTESVCAFNGAVAQKMSTQLDPIFKEDGVVTVNAIPAVMVNPDPIARAKACMAYRSGRLYFSYPSASSSTPDTTLVFSVKRSQWFTATGMLDEGNWYTDSRAFTALYDEGQGGALLGAYGGSVYELETGTDETNIPLIYQSRYENQGAPENLKCYADVLVEHNTGGRTFTAYAYLDDGATIVELGTFSSTAWTKTSFPLEDPAAPAEHVNIAVRLECALGNAIAEIRTLVAHVLPLERNAQTYDSGKIALREVSLLNAIEMELEILAGTASYTFSSDEAGAPAATLATLKTGELEGDNQTFQVALPDASEGRWVRLIVSGQNFRCHGARLQYQPIGSTLTPRDCEVMALLPEPGQAGPGVFLNSRTYDTGKVALEKASLLSTLEVELEIVSGAVNWTMYAGLTGLAKLDSGEFTGTDQTFTVQLPDGTEAWWVRLVLQGDNYRCHGARLQVQEYGCYLVGVGDIYRSGDLTLGSPRVKLLQQVRVDCDPDGDIAGAFYSDIPSAVTLPHQPQGAAQIETIELIETGGRTWQRTNLPYQSQGRVCRVELTAPAVCRIYAAQVRAKVLGEPGGWQWMDVPVPPTDPGFKWIPLGIRGAHGG